MFRVATARDRAGSQGLTGADFRGQAASASRRGGSSVRVAVLVDLERHPGAGGHVKCWERLAAAAVAAVDDIELTVHFQGQDNDVASLAPHVRLAMHRPLFSTAMLPFLHDAPDHTDLAPLHPRLLAALRRADVIHTTDAFFAFARTARAAARLFGARLVNSIHTDTPSYTRVYTDRVIRRAAGPRLARLLIDRMGVPMRMAARMQRRLDAHNRAADWVFRTPGAEMAAAGPRASVLRRGIDKAAFNPARRDRARLSRDCGIAADVPVLLFAGRIDPGKSVMTLAAAAAQLRRDGRPVHVIAAGSGSEAPEIHALLGPHATLPGTVDPATLAWLYASADLFVFPSRIEVLPNVVLEAKASGVPVVVAPEGGGVHVRTPGVDGVVVADPAPAAWAAAIAALLDDGDRRASLAAAGRADVERNHPSWEDVLSDDLAPVWRTVARGKHAEPVDVGRSDPASRPASR